MLVDAECKIMTLECSLIINVGVILAATILDFDAEIIPVLDNFPHSGGVGYRRTALV